MKRNDIISTSARWIHVGIGSCALAFSAFSLASCSSSESETKADSGLDSSTEDSRVDAQIVDERDSAQPRMDANAADTSMDSSLEDSQTADVNQDDVSQNDVNQDTAEQDATEDTAQDTAPQDVASDQQDADSGITCTPINPTPGVTLQGKYPLDGWTWKREGILFEPSADEALTTYGSPTAVVVNDKIQLWFTKTKKHVSKVFYTESDDGETFNVPKSTKGLDDTNSILYPSALYFDDQYHIYLGGGYIRHGKSDDGITWGVVKTPALNPADSPAFDSSSLGALGVVSDGSGYGMYYTGFNGKDYAIGLAKSANGTTWTRHGKDPVLSKTANGFDNTAVAMPGAYHINGHTLIWYSGYDTSLTNPGPYRIGLAMTKDNKTFKRVGVSLDLEAKGKEAWSTREPSVVRFRDKWMMYYVAMGDDGVYRIARASSETCAPE